MLIFIFGLIIGSFLNVCIYRIPRGESVIYPKSCCPSCGKPLAPYDLVPVLSFLWLRARCRFCQSRISWRYPLVEILTGSIFLMIFLVLEPGMKLVPYFFLASLLIIISFIDIDFYRIPNQLIGIGFLAGTVLMIMFSFNQWGEALLGVLLGGGLLLILAVLSKGGMGGGDVKLAGLIGFFLGWRLMVIGLFLAALLASIVGIILIALGKKRRKDPLPFAPFLSIGALVALMAGDELTKLYLELFFM
ncbi:MAG: prepilin peptidase [Desulfitobacteriaceae bacterium]|nr:prepilin peptidase [Desulfitobacteriaceae bacterium]